MGKKKTKGVVRQGGKSPALKARLGKAMKSSRRIPIFVVAKTKRKVRFSNKRRHWRTNKLKLSV